MEKKLITICAIVLFTSGSASAGFTVYPNDRPGWESTVGIYEEEFFTDATLNPGVSVVSDVGYVDTSKGVWWDKLVCPGWSYQGHPGPTTTTWQFATPLVGFGGNWNPGIPGGPGAHIAVAVNGSWVSVGEISRFYTGEFWGFVSTEPFSAVRLSPGSYCSPPGGAWCETYELDNMVYSWAMQVDIDIYPNRTPNRVYLSRNYTIYVAVLGSASFDVADIDASTVLFGRIGTEASPVRGPIIRDFNRDGFADAQYGFRTFDCGFQLGDTEGVLTGSTTSGTPIKGSDSVLVLP